MSISVRGGRASEEPPKDPLTVILERLNSKHGTEFSEHHRINMQQIADIASKDDTLRSQAKNNPLDDFLLGFGRRFMDYIVEGYEKDQDFYGKVLDDDILRKQMEESLGEYVYDLLNK